MYHSYSQSTLCDVVFHGGCSGLIVEVNCNWSLSLHKCLPLSGQDLMNLMRSTKPYSVQVISVDITK